MVGGWWVVGGAWWVVGGASDNAASRAFARRPPAVALRRGAHPVPVGLIIMYNQSHGGIAPAHDCGGARQLYCPLMMQRMQLYMQYGGSNTGDGISAHNHYQDSSIIIPNS